MTTIRAHFDGKVFVPDEAVTAPTNTPLFILVGSKRPMKVKDLLNSGLVGMWKDRKDIKDSSKFARKLREEAQTRRRKA